MLEKTWQRVIGVDSASSLCGDLCKRSCARSTWQISVEAAVQDPLVWISARRISGSADQPADQRISGSASGSADQPADQRISGSASGSADQPADQRISGSASGSAHQPADQRISGSASGSADQRTSGSADQRISQRISGSADQRISQQISGSGSRTIISRKRAISSMEWSQFGMKWPSWNGMEPVWDELAEMALFHGNPRQNNPVDEMSPFHPPALMPAGNKNRQAQAGPSSNRFWA